MNIRRIIGKFTSPIFVPLRRFVAWGDQNFGTCDHRLMVVPVQYESEEEETEENNPPTISELQKKISKDKANMEVWDEETPDDSMVGC
jgi:hypothetical protein